MTKYHVTVSVSTTAYVGDVEADNPRDAWIKAQEFVKQFKDKCIGPREADDDSLYFDTLESVEPAKDGTEYVPARWK